MNIAIIPARGGSQRIHGKNIKMFHGKPIIAYSIVTALAAGIFDRIVVSTDSEAIAGVAVRYGAEVQTRDSYYCEDGVGTQEVVSYCLQKGNAMPDDMVCCIYATAPMMDRRDLYEGFHMLTRQGEGVVDYVMSAGYPPLQDAAQFYWGRAWEFLRNAPLISHRTRLIHVDPKRVCDINTPEDWDRALKMYEDLK